MKPNYSIFQILCSVSENVVNRLDVNRLIESAQKIAYTYLKFRVKNLTEKLLSRDFTCHELAIDAIAPLFERDESGVFIKIKSALERWQPPIETEEKALFFLNRLVAKSVEKYISELLRQSDPFFSSIMDSLEYMIHKKNYNKKRILGTMYIVEDHKNVNPGLLPDKTIMDQLPHRIFEDMNNILPFIFKHIKSETVFAEAIPLNALVLKIKQVRCPEYRTAHDPEFHDNADIDTIIKQALIIAEGKLEKSYIKKGKITSFEGDALKKALRDTAEDLKSGGINTGLHTYLMVVIPDLTFEGYKLSYQHIFEYLFKVLKKEIGNRLTSAESQDGFPKITDLGVL